MHKYFLQNTYMFKYGQKEILNVHFDFLNYTFFDLYYSPQIPAVIKLDSNSLQA